MTAPAERDEQLGERKLIRIERSGPGPEHGQGERPFPGPLGHRNAAPDATGQRRGREPRPAFLFEGVQAADRLELAVRPGRPRPGRPSRPSLQTVVRLARASSQGAEPTVSCSSNSWARSGWLAARTTGSASRQTAEVAPEQPGTCRDTSPDQLVQRPGGGSAGQAEQLAGPAGQVLCRHAASCRAACGCFLPGPAKRRA